MLVRTLHGRGATTVVEVHGELLFAPGGDVRRWKSKFSARVQAEVTRAAPSNGGSGQWAGRRTMRPHPAGGTLKGSIRRSSTNFRKTKGGASLYSAVGSTSSYALFVNDGTGVRGMHGGSAYEAKLLPPWSTGSPTLFLRDAWGKSSAPLKIKGQSPQLYFERGLTVAWRKMRLAPNLSPIGGAKGLMSGIDQYTPAVSDGTVGSSGTPAALPQWKAWRDAYYRDNKGRNYDGSLRRRKRASRAKGRNRRTPEQETRRKEQSAARSRAWREKNTADKRVSARKRDGRAFLDAMIKKYGARNVDRGSFDRDGDYWVVLIRVIAKDGKPAWVPHRAKAKH